MGLHKGWEFIRADREELDSQMWQKTVGAAEEGVGTRRGHSCSGDTSCYSIVETQVLQEAGGLAQVVLRVGRQREKWWGGGEEVGGREGHSF